ncbi:hypothetical protein [Agrobacterium sp. B1(2019)]|uniref:hypothetical protein n=1 Tax=Agrobacterium sp. B1(2019) TaxID=2607032 RepID=UPI0011F01727|nr:hypothetical protein [Agrobacterium sp. B1(2019)]TZG37624.1 hypothetical protein AGR1_09560 [Agrobacterium sp. B1(2019)]
MTLDPETARYLIELDDEIQKLWQRLESHTSADEYRRIAQDYREKSKKINEQTLEYKTELASQIKSLNEESARYVNIVSVIGYAGYFTTWGFTKDILEKEMTAFVGLAGMLSVGLFVIWEMFNVLLRFKTLNAIAYLFQSGTSVEHFEEISSKLKQDEARTIAIYAPIHGIVFSVSFIAAIGGGLAMMHKLYLSL